MGGAAAQVQMITVRNSKGPDPQQGKTSPVSSPALRLQSHTHRLRSCNSARYLGSSFIYWCCAQTIIFTRRWKKRRVYKTSWLFGFFSPNHSFVFWLLQDSGASLKARAKASPEKSARLKLLQIRLDESAQNRHFQSASGSQRAWPYNTTQD